MQYAKTVFAAMALVATAFAAPADLESASSPTVKWCTEANLKGNCYTVDASTFCSPIPHADACGDAGSSAQLKKGNGISICTYYETDNCQGNGIDFTGKEELTQGWHGYSFFCK